jgi:pyruvate-ferredoxin/flavodoxin oxidoreductase
MTTGFDQHKAAVDSGAWVLYRYDPRRAAQGLNPLQLNSKAPKIPLQDYAYNETRFRMLTQSKPAEAERLMALAQQDVNERWRMYEQLASLDYSV